MQTTADIFRVLLSYCNSIPRFNPTAISVKKTLGVRAGYKVTWTVCIAVAASDHTHTTHMSSSSLQGEYGVLCSGGFAG